VGVTLIAGTMPNDFFRYFRNSGFHLLAGHQVQGAGVKLFLKIAHRGAPPITSMFINIKPVPALIG
jgi:hypothetical protein